MDEESYSKYYFELDEEAEDGCYSIDIPNDSGGKFNLQTRYHTLTGRWFINITYNKGKISQSTGWLGLVVSPSLNFNYQNVMPMSVGLESYIGFSPKEPEDLTSGFYRFYLTDWMSIQYI